MIGAGATAPRIDHYDWADGREPMLRVGPPDAALTAMVALPLLEEANRTRVLALAMLRRLASRGIAGLLPELPGTGESLLPTSAIRLANLRSAFAAAREHIGTPTITIAVRSGALLDAEGDAVVLPTSVRAELPKTKALNTHHHLSAPLSTSRSEGAQPDQPVLGRWHLSPQAGDEVTREWRRLRDAGDRRSVAGNHLTDALWTDLAGAVPPPARVVRLHGDPRAADRVVDAPPPWRRAEPTADQALATLLADDVADWIARCAA